MSVHITSDVWRYSRATGPALLVLLSMADQAGDDGECWPKLASIAERCRLSRASVCRHLDALRTLGEIEWDNRSSERRPSLYRVTVGPPSQIETTPPVSDCDPSRLNCETTPVSTVRPHEPSVEPSVEPKDVATASLLDDLAEEQNKAAATDLFEDFWSIFPRRVGARPKKPARLAWDRALKRGHDPASIIAAASIMAKAHPEPTPFVPMPSTWLNQERWTDDAPAPAASAAPALRRGLSFEGN